MTAPPCERRYFAYGLTIVTDLAFPELRAAPPGACDVRVRLATAADRPFVGGTWVFKTQRMACARTPAGYLIRFQDLADFALSTNGRDIVCGQTLESGDEVMLRHLVLDQILPLTFKLRGIEALHATAILTSSGVCAFLGPTGSGKSTVAAGFLKAGYPVMSDDCLPVFFRGDEPCAIPAYPGLRLCADAFAAFRENGDVVRPIGPHTAKQRWVPARAVDSFPTDAAPLKRIYRLVPGNQAPQLTGVGAAKLERLTARETLMELVDETFRLDPTDEAMLAEEFRFWERVALAVPARRLRIGRDLSSTEAREQVLEDLRAG
jgi:hypothetical protein